MKKTDLSRRDFNRLSMAAFGGVVAGTFAGCANEGEDATAPSAEPPVDDPSTMDPMETDPTATEGGEAEAGEETASLLMGEKHVCRGLNKCKSDANACAGQGTCATFAAHECGTHNECKGQGGCGDKPGENACKGMGKCHVPLKEHAWVKARPNFEAAMTAAGKEAGPAPAAAG
jgi:hypothetical protein